MACIGVCLLGLEHLGHNLRFYRQLRGLAQHALAAQLGQPFTQPYISRLECGWRPSNSCHIDALAAELGVSRKLLLRRPKIVQSHRPVVVMRRARVQQQAVAK